MPLYTRDEIKAKIEVLDAKITKAENAQGYEAGAGIRLERGSLAAMYRERERWIKEYERLEALEGGGLSTKVEFERPR
jgi:hypothetical protein